MKTVAELRQMRAAALDRMKAIVDTADTREDVGMTEDEERQYAELKEEADRILSEQTRREELTGLLQSVEPVAVQEQRAMGTGRQAIDAPAYHQRPTADTPEAIFLRHVRTGDQVALDELNAEMRASNDTGMNITTAGDGGNAVPTGHYRGIIARRDEVMMRDRLGVMMVPGTGTTVNVPTDAEADGEFVATSEMGDDNSTNVFDRDAPALGTVAMTLAKYTKKIEITDELLYDEDSRLLAFLENWLGRGMGRTHNSLLLTELAANGTAGLTLDSATAIGLAEVPELVGKLMPEYQDNARWIMHPTTWAYIQGLSGTSQFYFAPNPGSNTQGAQGGAAGFQGLWGFPLHASSYATSYAASAKSMFFGNYEFVGNRESPGLTFLRDPYTVDGKVILKYHFRTVYKVLQAEAIQYATHPSA
jgi:HK97 family phage major capsid protein